MGRTHTYRLGLEWTGSTGSGRFGSVVRQPTVTVRDAAMTEAAQDLHALAHEGCFIAASVRFPVTRRPTTLVASSDQR